MIGARATGDVAEVEVAEAKDVVLHALPDAQLRLGGIGKTTLYTLMAAGELRVVHIGRRAFIPSDSIQAFIGRRSASTGADGNVT